MGWGVGGERVTRKSGGIRETGRRRDSSEDGLPFSFLSVCQGICRAFKRKSKPKNQVFSLFPSVAIYPSGLSHQFQSFADISRCLPPFELRRNKRPRVGGALKANQ